MSNYFKEAVLKKETRTSQVCRHIVIQWCPCKFFWYLLTLRDDTVIYHIRNPCMHHATTAPLVFRSVDSELTLPLFLSHTWNYIKIIFYLFGEKIFEEHNPLRKTAVNVWTQKKHVTLWRPHQLVKLTLGRMESCCLFINIFLLFTCRNRNQNLSDPNTLPSSSVFHFFIYPSAFMTQKQRCRRKMSKRPVGWLAAVPIALAHPPLPAATPHTLPARQRAPGCSRRTAARIGQHAWWPGDQEPFSSSGCALITPFYSNFKKRR